MTGGSAKKIKCMGGGVGEKNKMCGGGVSENFPVRPPLRISNGIALITLSLQEVLYYLHSAHAVMLCRSGPSCFNVQCCPQSSMKTPETKVFKSHMLLFTGREGPSVCRGTRIFWGGHRGGQFFSSVGQRVKEWGQIFFWIFLCLRRNSFF